MQNPNGEMRNQRRNKKLSQASIPSMSHTNQLKQWNSWDDQSKAGLKPSIPNIPGGNKNSELT